MTQKQVLKELDTFNELIDSFKNGNKSYFLDTCEKFNKKKTLRFICHIEETEGIDVLKTVLFWLVKYL